MQAQALPFCLVQHLPHLFTEMFVIMVLFPFLMREREKALYFAKIRILFFLLTEISSNKNTELPLLNPLISFMSSIVYFKK